MEALDSSSRKDRKKEGREIKRQRIEASGGIRPRKRAEDGRDGGGGAVLVVGNGADEASGELVRKASNDPSGATRGDPKPRTEPTHSSRQGSGGGAVPNDGLRSEKRERPQAVGRTSGRVGAQQKPPPPRGDLARRSHHRFGRVMDQPPCPNRPRTSTLTIAIPGSVVANCQTRELKTALVGQVARAATIYHVDEIVVYDDQLASHRSSSPRHGGFREGRRSGERSGARSARPTAEAGHDDDDDNRNNSSGRGDAPDRPSFSTDPHAFMARLLQYCECPQYLRRHFFPMHPDLQFAGLLPPMDAPHHVRADDRAPFREGVVLEEVGPSGTSLVNCGIRNRPVEIDARLTPGIRCTVQLDPAVYTTSNSSSNSPIPGKVVSPSTPRETSGTYWGYTTRLASSIKAVFDEGPYDRYDLKIGTSERGTQTLDQSNYSVPSFKHGLVVFGGVAGIEECVDADESIKVSGSMSYTLFDQWVNICPFQGSRTIRTEEAVLIGLAKLSPVLSASMTRPSATSATTSRQAKHGKGRSDPRTAEEVAPSGILAFSDSEPSDESSGSDED